MVIVTVVVSCYLLVVAVAAVATTTAAVVDFVAFHCSFEPKESIDNRVINVGGNDESSEQQQ